MQAATKKTQKLVTREHKRIGPGQIILLFLVFLFTVFCFAPVLLVFISAFTDEMFITQHGFTFFPGSHWSMNGMNSVLRYGSQLATSYAITIGITVIGTFLGLLIMSMYAYSISRPGFRLAGFLSIFVLIPMLFNGGQLSGYIVFTSWYGLKDSLLLLILPLCVTTMNVIILRTYIANSIPGELMEAATIDGAGSAQKLWYVTMPMISPTTFYLIIVRLIAVFKVFSSVNIMTMGSAVVQNTSMVNEIYDAGFVSYKFGYASAEAMVLFIIILVITLINFAGQKKWVHY